MLLGIPRSGKSMNEAVEAEKFEEAAALRDELRALEKEGAKHDEP